MADVTADRAREAEAYRLEQLWAGSFGDAYIERNRQSSANRNPFWKALLEAFPAKRILEVGCNIGANLQWIIAAPSAGEVWGLDVNLKSLQELRSALPAVQTVRGRARELPFPDRRFDLVFTMGVLIHQPPDTAPLVMREIVRCSGRYVLCGEYHADAPTEVPYRGQRGALFKQDFGAKYQALFPELQLRKHGFLSRSEGWDDMTYWMFEKASA